MNIVKVDWSLFRPMTVVKMPLVRLEEEESLYVIIRSFPAEELHFVPPDILGHTRYHFKPAFVESTIDIELIPMSLFDKAYHAFPSPSWEFPRYEQLYKSFLVGDLGYLVQSQEFQYNADYSTFDYPQISITLIREPSIDKDEE